MIPLDTFLTYTLACVLLVLAPGPDNLLAIGRGISQGRIAAILSGASSGTGIVFHVLAATFGLTLLMQTSEVVFYIVKFVGAAYLIYLGVRVFKNRSLFSLETVAPKSYKNIILTGFLSAALNPKPGLFVLAFVPQFVNPELGSVTFQMLVYGLWFALLTGVGFACMGVGATKLATFLYKRPNVLNGLNIGAGATFIGSGLAVALMKQR